MFLTLLALATRQSLIGAQRTDRFCSSAAAWSLDAVNQTDAMEHRKSVTRLSRSELS